MKKSELAWALGISLGTALLVVAPFFVLGIASGHDFEFHGASWLDVAGQWKEGILFPRWAEWANYGFGEPRFIFYPPVSWILGAALGSVMRWNAVPVVFIVLAQTIAGLCAFALCRAVTARGAALFGAALYAANPYALLVVYMRSDFAEQLGTACFPLLLLLAMRISGILSATSGEPPDSLDLAKIGRSDAAPLQRPEHRGVLAQAQNCYIAWFAVVYAVVWLCNAPAGVMASYAMALVFAWTSLRARSLAPGLRGAAGLALGLGLAGFYLLPAAYEQRWVNIGQALASGLQPAQNFLYTAIDDPEHTWFNWIASSIAMVLVVITGTAAALAHRRLAGTKLARAADEYEQKVWGTVLLLAVTATLLMMRFTNIFWNVLPKLRFVQFPWRWMCVLAVGYAFFLACACGRSRRGWLLGFAATALSVATAGGLTQQTWWDSEDLPTLRAAIASGSGFDGTDEYDPRGDDHYDLPAKSPAAQVLRAGEEGDAPKAEVRIQAWTAQEKRLRVISPEAARIALRLLDYPAWSLEVNGRRITPEHAEGLAQMVVPLQAGTSEVRVRWVRTADRTVGDGISLASLCALVGLLISARGGRPVTKAALA